MKHKQTQFDLAQTKGIITFQFAERNMKVLKERGIADRKWIRWNQENNGQDCVMNQEVDGSIRGRKRDRPGQEVEQVIDAVNTKEVAGVH